MTREEADKIISILLTADDGCPACTKGLIIAFGYKFPRYKKLANRRWEEEIGDDF